MVQLLLALCKIYYTGKTEKKLLRYWQKSKLLISFYRSVDFFNIESIMLIESFSQS